MTPFNLKDEEIKSIGGYIKTESEKARVAAKGPAAGAEEKKGGNTFLYLLIAAVVLYVVIRMVSRVQRAMEKVLRHRHGLPEPVPVKATKRFVTWARNNKKLVAVILIVLFVLGNVKGWYLLAGIGISQGYHPDQPIAFSHKIQAGDNGINCKYCHFGAEKGKTAGVPPANVCMNCHKFIKEGSITGKEEIAKIYKALDYNPETQTYGPNKKPIQWVRVHNLPDLSYFNHSQHVKVAGVLFENSHRKMAVEGGAKQNGPPTIGGWVNRNCKKPA